MLKRVEHAVVLWANIVFIVAGIVKADAVILLIALSGLSCYAALKAYEK